MTGRLRLVQHEAFLAAPEQVPARLLDGPVSFAGLDPRPITSQAALDLSGHSYLFGPRPRTAGAAAADLLSRLDAAAVTGRGGGHMAVTRKWRQQLRHGGGGIVVMNAAEGEPASAKDRTLLLLRPHLALDGLACAAEAVGAREAVVWLHEDDPLLRAAVVEALAQRRAAGVPDIHTRVVGARPHYLSGESSAIVRALAGGPPLPQFRREPGAPGTVDGRPVLVHNVDTLARVALVARGHPVLDAMAATVLLTVVHESFRTVVEVAPTALLQDVVLAITAPISAAPTPRAVLVGGYGGRWVPWHALDGVPAHEGAMRARGASLGAGVLVPVLSEECGLEQAAYLAEYLADHSARQCGPCHFGLPAVAETMRSLVSGAAGRLDLRRLDRHLAEISGRGGCHHPDGAVAMVSSALSVFADDVSAHRRGRCVHGAAPPFAELSALDPRRAEPFLPGPR